MHGHTTYERAGGTPRVGRGMGRDITCPRHRTPVAQKLCVVTSNSATGRSIANHARSISHPLSRVKSGGGAASLLAVAGRIACKDARLFEVFSYPWRPSSTFYKLL